MNGRGLGTIEIDQKVNYFNGVPSMSNPLFERSDEYGYSGNIHPDLTPEAVLASPRAERSRTIVAAWIDPSHADLIARQTDLQQEEREHARLLALQRAEEEYIHATTVAYTPQAQGLGVLTVAELASQVNDCWDVIQGHVDRNAACRARKQALGIPRISRLALKQRASAPPIIQDYEAWNGFLPEGPVAVEDIPVMGSPIVVSVAPDSEYFGVPRELVDSSLAPTITMPRVESDPQTGPYAFQAEYTTDSLPVITDDGENPEAIGPAAAEYEAEAYQEYLPAADAIEEEIPEEPQPKVGLFGRLRRRFFAGRRAAKTALREVVLVETEEPPADTAYEGSGTPVQGIDLDTITTTPIDVPKEYIGQNGMQYGSNPSDLPLLAEAGQALEDKGNNQHHQ